MKIIVLDPGHGGEDLGAVNGTRYEKNDNLRLSLAVRDVLKQYGHSVVMTRDSDIYIPLLDRSLISNRAGADAFISLHRNYSGNQETSGIESFVQIGSPSVDADYARTVVDSLVRAGAGKSLGVKKDNFSVLRNTHAPAQLLNVGFITNFADNQIFDKNLSVNANAVAVGILQALGESTVLPQSPPPAPLQESKSIIREIQSTLNSRYGAGLSLDGITGPETKRAVVKGLQAQLNRDYGAGLLIDGKFGPDTRSAMPNVRQGARGNIVWLIQAALVLHGFPLTGLEGVMGPETLAAVRAFQADNNLSVDGIVGSETAEKLFKF